MSRLNIVEEFIGSTLRVTVVNSGATISPISSALYDRAGLLTHSISMTSSGAGFYYSGHLLPNTPQKLLNEVIAVINANTYRRYQIVDVQWPRIGP